jgi:predicted metal-dependent phosphoesterase TrpH
MIDLHSHTTASDGQHPPATLLEMAARAGVTALAVTDHDTVAAIGEARRAAEAHGIELVPGIELSAFLSGREIHVLGHFVNPLDADLGGFAEMLRKERRMRMDQMVAKMRGLGYPVTIDEVLALAQDAQLGRPHLARVLVEKRICTSVKEGFDRFLGDGKPAWVDRYRLPAVEAITLIHDAGGTATLAHPGTSRVNEHEIKQLREVGLDGLEVHHSDHVPSLREKLQRVARELGLVETAGSDFHGEAIAPNRHLGTAGMARDQFEELRKRSSARA